MMTAFVKINLKNNNKKFKINRPLTKVFKKRKSKIIKKNLISSIKRRKN